MTTVFDVLAETIRVLIGDDHRIVREGLKQMLADAPDLQVVAEAQTGTEVLERVRLIAGIRSTETSIHLETYRLG